MKKNEEILFDDCIDALYGSIFLLLFFLIKGSSRQMYQAEN
jgi:hypothetical protein